MLETSLRVLSQLPLARSAWDQPAPDQLADVEPDQLMMEARSADPVASGAALRQLDGLTGGRARTDELMQQEGDDPKKASRLDPNDLKQIDRYQRQGPAGATEQIQAQQKTAAAARPGRLRAIAEARARADALPPAQAALAGKLRAGANRLERLLEVEDKGRIAAANDYPALRVDEKTGKTVRNEMGQVAGYRRYSFEELTTGIGIPQKDGTVKTIRFTEAEARQFNLARGVDMPAGAEYNDARVHRVSVFVNEANGKTVVAYQQTQFIFEGAKNLSDPTMQSNLQQGRGYGSTYYDNGIAAARLAQAKLDGADWSFTGSSKGGALATAAALATGVRADVFNPAWVHENTLVANGVSPGTRTEVVFMPPVVAIPMPGSERTVDRSFNEVAQAAGPDGLPLVEAFVVGHDLVNNAMFGFWALDRAGLNPVPTNGGAADIRGKLTVLPNKGYTGSEPTSAAHGGWTGAATTIANREETALRSLIAATPKAPAKTGGAGAVGADGLPPVDKRPVLDRFSDADVTAFRAAVRAKAATIKAGEQLRLGPTESSVDGTVLDGSYSAFEKLKDGSWKLIERSGSGFYYTDMNKVLDPKTANEQLRACTSIPGRMP